MTTHQLEKYRAAEKKLFDHYGVAPVEHFFHLPQLDCKVRVLEIGQGDPVVFVHGSPNASPKWTPLVAKMAGFRCLLVDRPGCGLSEPVDYTRTDLRALASGLIGGVLDALGLAQAPLVVSSLGGALGFYFTRQHPKRVSRLVQEGCPGFITGFHLPPPLLMGLVISLLTGRAGPSAPSFRSMGHGPAMDAGRFESQVLAWRDALLRYTATVRHENALNLHLMRRMKGYTIDQAFVGEIEQPTLYLWGENDTFAGPAIGQALSAAQPNAELRSFPNAGHLPWLDDAATHASLICDFLRR